MGRTLAGSWSWRLAVGIRLMLSSGVPFADTDPALEVIIVSAQRTDQPAQDVPIALTALSEQMLEERQIIGVSDLQLSVPNLSYGNTQFGAANLSIRGVGRLIYTADGEPGVSVHIHSVGLPTNLTSTEFYDMDRVEVLRGPQGTLYGRNAAGGVVNLITKLPGMDTFEGFIDLEGGDYNHERVKGALNVPLGESLAFRVAGMYLKRDGYMNNRAAGQVPGIDDDLDGRDLHSYRISGEWRPTDDTRAWAIYQRFEEDDDRAHHEPHVQAESVPDGRLRGRRVGP